MWFFQKTDLRDLYLEEVVRGFVFDIQMGLLIYRREICVSNINDNIQAS